tara:strand:- start:1513 stop:1728 length:216 start_codon:yes stop_codon:yes gene_type:complete
MTKYIILFMLFFSSGCSSLTVKTCTECFIKCLGTFDWSQASFHFCKDKKNEKICKKILATLENRGQSNVNN